MPEDQEGTHVLGHALLDHHPAGQHHDDRDEGGQRHEPQRDAVQAQEVADTEAVDPGRLFDELVTVRQRIEVLDQRESNDQADQRPEQRQPAGQARIAVAAQCQDEDAEDDRYPDREAQDGKC